MNHFDSIVLGKHIRRLPQEIFDMIYNEVFIAPAATRRVRQPGIAGYTTQRVPHLMHVSRETRKHYAISYYSKSVFVFQEPYDCFAWLRSLQPEYLKLLRDIRYVVSDQEARSGRASWVRSFWTQGVKERVGQDVAECLRFRTTAELMRELEIRPAVEEWDAWGVVSR